MRGQSDGHFDLCRRRGLPWRQRPLSVDDLGGWTFAGALGRFPFGTLLVNTLGSFALALFWDMVRSADRAVAAIAPSGRRGILRRFYHLFDIRKRKFQLVGESRNNCIYIECRAQ